MPMPRSRTSGSPVSASAPAPTATPARLTASPPLEGLVGLEYHLTQRFSLFGDYKLSYSNNDASLKDGGSLQTDVVTNHFIFGASYRFGGGPAPEAYDPYK